MKLLETTVISTQNEKRAKVQMYIIAVGVASMIVGTFHYFKHGDQWGWPNPLASVLIFVGLLVAVGAVVWMRLDLPVGLLSTLFLTKEDAGLQFRISNNAGDQRLDWPFEWEHWQSFKKMGEDEQCLVENVRIRSKKGDFFGFTESFPDLKTANLGIAVREGRLGNHASVFEIEGIRQLVTVLEKEAWGGYIQPLLPEGSTKENWGDLIG